MGMRMKSAWGRTLAVLAVVLFELGAPYPSAAQVLDYNLPLSHEAGPVQSGFATYYAAHFEGRRTASGTTFRHEALVAAHRSLPFGTLARVTNVTTGHSVVVRVTDRGPNAGTLVRKAIIDLSRAAAERLDMLRHGRVPVEVKVLASSEERSRKTVRIERSELYSSSAELPQGLMLRMDLGGVELDDAIAIRQCDVGICSLLLVQLNL